MADLPGQPSLEKTLRFFGETLIDDADIEVVDYSPASEPGNASVYAAVNMILLDAAGRRAPGECTHITGEMKAIADPLHRQVCRAIWNRRHTRFLVVTFIPDGVPRTGMHIAARNRAVWGGTGWHDQVGALDLLAEGVVELRATRTLEPIHYSVFDDSFVLLQAQHDHEQHIKEVWILRSETIHAELARHARQTAARARRVRPSGFARYLADLEHPLTLRVLEAIAAGAKPAKPQLDERLEVLAAVGLVDLTGETASLTDDGRGYLELIGVRDWR